MRFLVNPLILWHRMLTESASSKRVRSSIQQLKRLWRANRLKSQTLKVRYPQTTKYWQISSHKLYLIQCSTDKILSPPHKQSCPVWFNLDRTAQSQRRTRVVYESEVGGPTLNIEGFLKVWKCLARTGDLLRSTLAPALAVKLEVMLRNTSFVSISWRKKASVTWLSQMTTKRNKLR